MADKEPMERYRARQADAGRQQFVVWVPHSDDGDSEAKLLLKKVAAASLEMGEPQFSRLYRKLSKIIDAETTASTKKKKS